MDGTTPLPTWATLPDASIPTAAAELGVTEAEVRAIRQAHQRTAQIARRLAHVAGLMDGLNKQAQALPTTGATRAQQRQLRRIGTSMRGYMDETARLVAEHDALAARLTEIEARITSQQERQS